MAVLESVDVEKALMGKMKAERQESGDWYYIVSDEQGVAIGSTSISKGAKHTLGPNRISQMARQLNLNKSQLFVDLVRCPLKREKALEIMKINSLPGNPRLRD
jgi:hypothetical protein